MDLDSVENLGGPSSSAEQNQVQESECWTLLSDGSSTKKGSGVGIMLKSPEGMTIKQEIRLGFMASNNEAKHESLIMGLKNAKLLGAQNMKIHCNSQLVANYLTREYAASNQMMEAYMNLAQRLFKDFDSAYIEWFSRSNNSHADALATFASAINSTNKRTIEVEFLPKLSTEADQVYN